MAAAAPAAGGERVGMRGDGGGFGWSGRVGSTGRGAFGGSCWSLLARVEPTKPFELSFGF
jgi:hypothetical protein